MPPLADEGGAAAGDGGTGDAAAAGVRFRGVFGAPGAPGAMVAPFFFPFSTARMSLAAEERTTGGGVLTLLAAA